MVAWAWASPLSSLEADAHRRRPSPTSLDFFFFCWNIWGVEIQKEKKIYINFFLRPGCQSLICPGRFGSGSRSKSEGQSGSSGSHVFHDFRGWKRGMDDSSEGKEGQLGDLC